ncbi:MAG: HAMP domain-containing protein [Acidobacteriota bacterium]|nr:MAG: HAMP domain-containing protein [Acidobacteriota bacterium]
MGIRHYFPHLLGTRLFFFLTLALTVGLAGGAWFVTHFLKNVLTESVHTSGEQLGETIRRSARRSMLRNRRDELKDLIHELKGEKGIHAVHVYNKDGVIVVSTDSSQEGTRADLRGPACRACHHDGAAPREEIRREDMFRVFELEPGNRLLGVIIPILNEPECSDAACHAHPPTQKVLGVKDVQISLARTDAYIARIQKLTAGYFAVLVLAVSVAAGLFVWRIVHRPIKALRRGTQAVAQGNLNYRIPVSPPGELGQLAESFNRMTEELTEARDKLADWSQALEIRVKQKTEELQKAHSHFLYMEKMASLGKLAGIVAHEINNPLSSIRTYSKIILRQLDGKVGEGQPSAKDDAYDEIRRHARVISDEAARCGELVKNLFVLARPLSPKLAVCRLHDVVRDSLQVLTTKMAAQNVTVKCQLFKGDDQLVCDEQHLKQALMALVVNAAEAMPEGGTLSIVTSELGRDYLQIRIRDTGSGIPADITKTIFEPFFSTKLKPEQNIGVGLTIVERVAEEHGGMVKLEETTSQGSTFVLTFPRRPFSLLPDRSPGNHDFVKEI